MKHLRVIALMCLCACSTSEKPVSEADSTATATQEQVLATTPAATTPTVVREEPDPIVDDPSAPDPDMVDQLASGCLKIDKGLYSISTGEVEGPLDSALYLVAIQYASVQGYLRSITTVDDFLDGDKPTNPRRLMAVVFLTEEVTTDQSNAGGENYSSTISPTLTVFEHNEEDVLTLITYCNLPAWNGDVRSMDGAPAESLVVGSVELIPGQSAVTLEYIAPGGFVDIDHTLESTSVDWYALAQNQVLRIFSYTPHFKEHVSAGDGENSSDYQSDVEISIKRLNSERLRLVQLTTTYEMGEKINMYGEEPAPKPDGIYSYNGVYYAKVKEEK